MTQLYANMRADCNFLGRECIAMETTAKLLHMAYIEERAVVVKTEGVKVIGVEKET